VGFDSPLGYKEEKIKEKTKKRQKDEKEWELGRS